MFGFLGIIIPRLLGIIDKVVPNTAEAERIKGEITRMALQGKLKELEAAASIITAEANGNWLQRSWRPALMVMFMIIIGNNYLIASWFRVPVIAIPPDMWDLLKIGVGGYVTGRSAEKVVRLWKNPDKG